LRDHLESRLDELARAGVPTCAPCTSPPLPV
jgi:hypothetical protein